MNNFYELELWLSLLFLSTQSLSEKVMHLLCKTTNFKCLNLNHICSGLEKLFYDYIRMNTITIKMD